MRYFNWLPIALLGLTACGQGFQSTQSTPSTQEASPLPVTPIQNAKTITTSLGSVTYGLQSKDSMGTTYAYDLKVPYGRVFEITSDLSRWLTPNACRWIKGVEKESALEYRDGEIPCGKILNSSKKEIIELDIKDYSGTHSGFKVKVGGFNIPIEVNRTQRSGTYKEDSLDNRAVESRTSSTKFGNDISVRYVPHVDRARVEVCMNIPGTVISAPSRKIHGKASKKVLGFNLSHSSSFTVDPGQASYDYGRGCFAADVNWTATQTAPKIDLKVTKNPYLQNVQYKGLNIKINDWFLRLVDKIVSFFRTSVRKELTNKMVKKVNDIADRDIESGAWLTRTHTDDLLKEAGQRLSERMNRIIARSGTPTSPAAVRGLLKDQCRLLKLSNSALWTSRLETLCREYLDRAEIQVERFAVDADSQAAGCFNHFANIHQSKGKWWSKTCKFATRFSVTMPSSIEDFTQEISELVASHLSLSAIPVDWQDNLEKLDVDRYTLSLLLEELEERGYKRIVASDWRQGIPAIVQEVKAKLLK